MTPDELVAALKTGFGRPLTAKGFNWAKPETVLRGLQQQQQPGEHLVATIRHFGSGSARVVTVVNPTNFLNEQHLDADQIGSTVEVCFYAVTGDTYRAITQCLATAPAMALLETIGNDGAAPRILILVDGCLIPPADIVHQTLASQLGSGEHLFALISSARSTPRFVPVPDLAGFRTLWREVSRDELSMVWFCAVAEGEVLAAAPHLSAL